MFSWNQIIRRINRIERTAPAALSHFAYLCAFAPWRLGVNNLLRNKFERDSEDPK